MLRFPLLDQMPAAFHGIIYDFWWDLDKLHSLTLPSKKIPTEKLLWHLDLPWWRLGDKPFQLTPNEVLKNPRKYQEQYGRTLAANLAYPVIVREVGDKIVIIDGIHRLLKAVMNNIPVMQCKIFSEELIPQILHEEA